MHWLDNSALMPRHVTHLSTDWALRSLEHDRAPGLAQHGDTPLTVAALRGQLDTVQLLLQFGAPADYANKVRVDSSSAVACCAAMVAAMGTSSCMVRCSPAQPSARASVAAAILCCLRGWLASVSGSHGGQLRQDASREVCRGACPLCSPAMVGMRPLPCYTVFCSTMRSYALLCGPLLCCVDRPLHIALHTAG